MLSVENEINKVHKPWYRLSAQQQVRKKPYTFRYGQ